MPPTNLINPTPTPVSSLKESQHMNIKRLILLALLAGIGIWICVIILSSLRVGPVEYYQTISMYLLGFIFLSTIFYFLLLLFSYIPNILGRVFVSIILVVALFTSIVFLGVTHKVTLTDPLGNSESKGVPNFKPISGATSVSKLAEPYGSFDDLLSQNRQIINELGSGYVWQAGVVYFQTGQDRKAPLTGVSSNDFRQFEATQYGVSSDHVYAGANILANADRNTFVAFTNSGYALDKNTIYFSGSVLPEADPKTFKPLNRYYAKDAYNVFYGNVIFGADVATFSIREDGFALDSEGLVCTTNAKPQRMPDVDVSSLKTLQRNELAWIVVDKNRAYNLKKCSTLSANGIDADPTTLKVFGNFAKDASHVFFLGDPAAIYDPGTMLVENVDPKTFTQLFRIIRGDKNSQEIGIGAEDNSSKYEFYFNNSSQDYQWELRKQSK